MVLPAEGFAAHFTRKGSLVCMRPLVDQKVVGLGELPLAIFADELFLRPENRQDAIVLRLRSGAKKKKKKRQRE